VFIVWGLAYRLSVRELLLLKAIKVYASLLQEGLWGLIYKVLIIIFHARTSVVCKGHKKGSLEICRTSKLWGLLVWRYNLGLGPAQGALL
jgi:hypothetical protein